MINPIQILPQLGHGQGSLRMHHLYQTPLPENGNLAVVATMVVEDGQCIIDFGTAKSNGDACEAINLARVEADNRIKNVQMDMKTMVIETQTVPVTPSNSKGILNGGGDKPISSGQIKFINSLCAERKVNVSEFCNGDIEKLNGGQANEIINKLKAMR